MTEEQAKQLISDYEEAEVETIAALPEGEEAEFAATFADGHTVAFWTDDIHRLVENRVHIVSRS